MRAFNDTVLWKAARSGEYEQLPTSLLALLCVLTALGPIDAAPVQPLTAAITEGLILPIQSDVAAGTIIVDILATERVLIEYVFCNSRGISICCE